MKPTTLTLLLLSAATRAVVAAPTLNLDVSGVDFGKIGYPKGTGSKIHSYPSPAGGWSSIKYSGKNDDKNSHDDDDDNYNGGQNGGHNNNGGQNGSKNKNGPFKFTSLHTLTASPSQVVNGTTPTGGLPGALAYVTIGVNADEDYICYNVKLTGFKGDYRSPARTATHLHEAAKGMSGPPRMVFANPVVGVDGEGVRWSRGCVSAPYTTGINTTAGADTGAGFSAKQIEANPAGFFFDVHSSLAVPGAVRGQLG